MRFKPLLLALGLSPCLAWAQPTQKHMDFNQRDCVQHVDTVKYTERHVKVVFKNVCGRDFHVNVQPNNGKAGPGGYLKPGQVREFVCGLEECRSFRYTWN